MTRCRPVQRALTPEELERLMDLMAYGPLTRQPIDESLEVAGWIEPYDGDTCAVDAQPGAADILYDEHGRVRPIWASGGLMNSIKTKRG